MISGELLLSIENFVEIILLRFDSGVRSAIYKSVWERALGIVLRWI